MKIFKSPLLTAVIILISSLAFGLFIMCAIWLASGGSLEISAAAAIYRLSALVCVIIISTLLLVYVIKKNIMYRRISVIMESEGATPQLYAMLKNQADRARGEKAKAMSLLTLASYLAEGGHYSECYEVLDKIKTEKLNPFYQDEYHNVRLYANLMQGNIDGADEVLKNAKANFERARLREYNMPVLRTLGVYEYAKGNFAQAETLLMQAKNNAPTKQAMADCCLYLGLCYLKTGRKEYAKAAAEEAAGQVRTVYQKENLKKLMKLVEKAYAVSDGQ